MFHSDSDRGFSLVEVLVVLGVVGLLLTILVLSLNSKEAQIRDVKRLNDMNSLRNALSVLKYENGTYEQAYCEVGAVSACGRNANSRLRAYLPSLSSFNDPRTTDAACTDAVACAGGACNYAFVKFDADAYQVHFALEKGVDGYDVPGCYELTAAGIRKL